MSYCELQHIKNNEPNRSMFQDTVQLGEGKETDERITWGRGDPGRVSVYLISKAFKCKRLIVNSFLIKNRMYY